jgi:hypothetical protein
MSTTEKKKGIPISFIKLDKKYELQFGFKAMRAFKNTFGISIEEALSKNFDSDMAVNALWAMLLVKYNDVSNAEYSYTPEMVADLLDKYYEGSASEAVSLITDAVSLSLNGKTFTEMLKEITKAAEAAEAEGEPKNAETTAAEEKSISESALS